jgi:hypothetical protein
MKTLKVFLVTLFLSSMVATAVNAQAVIVKDQNWYYYGYVSYDAHEVVTPDGTINLRINWQFNMDDPMILEAIMNGSYSIAVNAISDYGVVPGIATFFKNGRVKFNGHLEP